MAAHQAPRPWDSPGKNTGAGCHSLLQGIFPIQGSNLGLLHCRQILYSQIKQRVKRKEKNFKQQQQPIYLTLAINIGEGNDTPLQYSCLDNPMDRGAWKAAVHGVAEGWTRLSDFTLFFHFHALKKEMPTLQCSFLENPRDGGAWWAAVYGVTQSWTLLKRLSSSFK